jgi:hypothetical protein
VGHARIHVSKLVVVEQLRLCTSVFVLLTSEIDERMTIRTPTAILGGDAQRSEEMTPT